MPDTTFTINANLYSTTSHLVATAIEESKARGGAIVEIWANPDRYDGIREQLFEACEGFDGDDLYRGLDGAWKVKLTLRD